MGRINRPTVIFLFCFIILFSAFQMFQIYQPVYITLENCGEPACPADCLNVTAFIHPVLEPHFTRIYILFPEVQQFKIFTVEFFRIANAFSAEPGPLYA